MNIKKPKEPRKPSKPRAPVKFYKAPFIIGDLDADIDMPIKDFLKGEIFKEISLDDVFVRSYLEGGYGYNSPYYRIIQFYYEKEYENSSFDSEMKKYEKRLSKYKKDMEEYTPKYEKYKKDFAIWKSQQKKKDKKNLEKEKEKLEKQLEKLKKEIANEQ